MSRLTKKQEEYVKGLIDGLSQRQAYYKAYPNSKKWKPETVDSRASKLFNSYKVNTRFNELKEQIDREHKEKKLWSMEQTANKLIWLINEAENDIKDKGFRQANSTAFLNALKELNELEGLGAERQARIGLNTAKIKETYKRVEKTDEEIKVMKGISEEIEDLSDIIGEIYGETEKDD